MGKQLRHSISLALLLGLLASSLASAKLVGWWQFDDGAGTTAVDSSGNGYNGTITGTPQWVAGQLDGALKLSGSSNYVNCGVIPIATNGTGAISVCCWLNRAVSADHKLCSDRQGNNAAGGGFTCTIYQDRMEMDLSDAAGRVLSRDATRPTIPGVNTWVHLAWVYDDAANTLKLYVNGVLSVTATVTQSVGLSTQFFRIGADSPNPGYYVNGTVDDLRLCYHAMSVEEIANAMKGIGPSYGQATTPGPADKATDIPRDVALGWTAGQFAGKHDVYFGTAFADVNSADRTNPKGVLAGQGQDAGTYDPAGLLDFGKTYYWRVDEVNKTPDGTIFKGAVWSFTAEPYAYPIKNVTATASGSQAGMGPENTINGSGLDKNDQHSTDAMTMWVGAGAKPGWIQYQFDRVYRLHEMWVWNSNQIIESFVGFGAKDVKIEYSLDGTTWAELPGVPQFAQAPGLAGYSHNTTINFGGVSARYVRLTIDSTWSGLGQGSLSEVRFFSAPVQAREPQPAAGATGVDLDVALNWRPGRQAASHQVYFGSDKDAVAAGAAPAVKVNEHSYSPASLQFGTTYYWKVNEVNEAAGPAAWEGEVWSFTTQQYAVVDDFESYTNDEGGRIYETWIDGWTNGTGAVVGYLQAPFAERTIVHGGQQSMPMEYNNIKTPFYSEAARQFAPVQDWMVSGATDLSLWVRGYPITFAETAPGVFTVSAAGTDIWGNSDQFRFVYKQLTGDGSIMARVESIGNTNVWAKAAVMIRESLDAGSTHVLMSVTPDGRRAFQNRAGAGGTSYTAHSNPAAITLPQWIKIERKGNQFTAYYSPDGKTWTKQPDTEYTGTDKSSNPQTINMAASVYIGLALSSHAAGVYTTAQYSGVATTGNVSGPWQAAAIGVAQPGNSPDKLYLVVEDSAGKAAVVTNPDPAAVNVTAWTQWKIPLSSFTGVNLSKVKKMYIGVGDRKNPLAAGNGRIYIDDIGFGRAQ